tara:strand:+ start:7883 stop:8620 length:738 start_codon:yes stop_codon:yes gene_type:complete
MIDRREPGVGEVMIEADDGEFGCVVGGMEHRECREYRPDGHAKQTADKVVFGVENFHRMGMAFAMKPHIEGAGLRGDPGEVRARWIARRGAAVDHAGEIGIERHLHVRATHGAAKPLGDVNRGKIHDGAFGWRPPFHGAPVALRIKATRHGLENHRCRQVIGKPRKSGRGFADARGIRNRGGRHQPVADETSHQPRKMPHALGLEPVRRGKCQTAKAVIALPGRAGLGKAVHLEWLRGRTGRTIG